MMVAANGKEALVAKLERIRWPPKNHGGRPTWTRERFHAAYREATDALGAGAGLAEIAGAMNYDPRHVRRLVERFGRPGV